MQCVLTMKLMLDYFLEITVWEVSNPKNQLFHRLATRSNGLQ